jgi:hypothetical protein
MNSKKNIIWNKAININSRNVDKCNDIEVLKVWLSSTQNIIDEISLQLKDKDNEYVMIGVEIRDKWYNSALKSKKKLGILVRQIQSRLAVLKSENKKKNDIKLYGKIQKERDYWKRLFKKHNPIKYRLYKEKYFSEIDEINDNL